MFRYFAYGSVLSLSHAREWATSHGMDVTPFLAGRPARLDGYRLVFDVPSRFWAGLVADLVPDASSSVEGVLFELPEEAREAVLRKEGVATGLYREHVEPVVVDGAGVEASVFSAEPARRLPEGPASWRYVQALVDGARERSLSPGWQASLERIERDAGRPPPPGVPLGRR
jgi:cation transport regulator ChaC